MRRVPARALGSERSWSVEQWIPASNRSIMERLSDIFPAADRLVGDLLPIRGRRLWAISIRKEAVQKPGLIRLCGLIGVMGGIQIGGASDPLSPCREAIVSNRVYQIVMAGSSLGLVAMYGNDFVQVSEERNRAGCCFRYRGLVMCFACRSIGLDGASLKSRLRAQGRHLRSFIE